MSAETTTWIIALAHGQRKHLAEPLVPSIPTGTMLTLCGIVSLSYHPKAAPADCKTCLNRARATERYARIQERRRKMRAAPA